MSSEEVCVTDSSPISCLSRLCFWDGLLIRTALLSAQFLSYGVQVLERPIPSKGKCLGAWYHSEVVKVGPIGTPFHTQLTRYRQGLVEQKNQHPKSSVSLSVSYMEFYKDEVYDLLGGRRECASNVLFSLCHGLSSNL